MLDVALAENGTKIGLSTSSDEDYPPENIIDGKTETFWAMTGLFPQEFVLSFRSVMEISQVTIHCCNVSELKIDSSTKSQLDYKSWELLSEDKLPNQEGQLTEKEFSVNTKAHHLRFSILTGHDSFASIHKVSVIGAAVQ